jgi:glyoxylase-like metal-dependent hydrolase (beta-lactamase superfamily II)
MRYSLAALTGACFLLSCATTTKEQGLVNKAADAMGGAQALSAIKTTTSSGSVKFWEPEQSDVPGGEPRFAAEAKLDTIADRASRTSRYDYTKNFAYPAPRTFTYSEIVKPDAGYVIGVDSNGRNAESMKASPPAHSMSGYRLATTLRERMRGSASGLISAMQANPDAVKPAADIVVQGRSLPAVSYQGLIVAFDPQTGLPERVRSLDYDNIWGDVTYDYVYSQWQEIDKVKVPMSRKYELNGRMVQETQLTSVRFNQPIDQARLAIPAAVLANAAKPATGNVPYQWVLRRQFIGTYMDSDNVSYDTKGSQGLRLQEISPGTFHVTGGTHNSLLVEMSDHLVIVDAPVTDAQSAWVMKATKERFPGKPIRWVVLTHHHMDHAGGVRGLLTDGGTLVVGQGSYDHFRRVLAAPITRNPDLKPMDFSRTPILEVPQSHHMSDGRRDVMVYVMDNPHAKGMLMAWVPDAKLGYVTDIWSPGVPLPAKPNPGLLSVVGTVKKIGIQPERFAGGHGSVAPYANLAVMAGQEK